MTSPPVAYTTPRGVFYHPPRSARPVQQRQEALASAPPRDGAREVRYVSTVYGGRAAATPAPSYGADPHTSPSARWESRYAAADSQSPAAYSFVPPTQQQQQQQHRLLPTSTPAQAVHAPTSAYSPLGQYLLHTQQQQQQQQQHNQNQPPRAFTGTPGPRQHINVQAGAPGRVPTVASPLQDQTAEEASQCAQPCWLCSYPVAQGPGSWSEAAGGLVHAPALFYGPIASTVNDADAGEDALQQQDCAWWRHYRLWLSGLSLCDVCALALSADLRATAESVLQRARHTPALSQHRTSFVNALREYKLLQEMIADRVVKAAQRFSATSAAKARLSSTHEGPSATMTTLATMTSRTSLWEAPSAVQKKVLSQLVQALEAILAADTDSSIPFTSQERHVFLEEIAHVERQAQRMQKGEFTRLKTLRDAKRASSHAEAGAAAGSFTATGVAGLEFDASDFADAAGTSMEATAEPARPPPQHAHAQTAPPLEQQQQPRQEPPYRRERGAAPGDVRAETAAAASANHAMRDRVEATFRAAHHRGSAPREPSARSDSISRSGRPLALDNDGGVRSPPQHTASPSRPADDVQRGDSAAAVWSPSIAFPLASHTLSEDTDSILARYFEGQSVSLPETIRLLDPTQAAAVAVADTAPRSIDRIQRDLDCASSLPTTDALLLPRDGSPWRNPTGTMTLYPPEATTAEALLHALLSTIDAYQTGNGGGGGDGDGDGWRGNDRERTEALARALTLCVSRSVESRLASDDALLTAHGKVAHLMKSANSMAEALLTHSLGFTFRAHLAAMETLMSSRLMMMQSYCLQKSLLFAEEMTTLVCLAQRRAYRLTLPTIQTVPRGKETSQSVPASSAAPPERVAANGAMARAVAPDGRAERKPTEPFVQASGLVAGQARSPQPAINPRQGSSPQRDEEQDREWSNFLEPQRPAGVDYQDWDSASDAASHDRDGLDQRPITSTRRYRS